MASGTRARRARGGCGRPGASTRRPLERQGQEIVQDAPPSAAEAQVVRVPRRARRRARRPPDSARYAGVQRVDAAERHRQPVGHDGEPRRRAARAPPSGARPGACSSPGRSPGSRSAGAGPGAALEQLVEQLPAQPEADAVDSQALSRPSASRCSRRCPARSWPRPRASALRRRSASSAEPWRPEPRRSRAPRGRGSRAGRRGRGRVRRGRRRGRAGRCAGRSRRRRGAGRRAVRLRTARGGRARRLAGGPGGSQPARPSLALAGGGAPPHATMVLVPRAASTAAKFSNDRLGRITCFSSRLRSYCAGVAPSVDRDIGELRHLRNEPRGPGGERSHRVAWLHVDFLEDHPYRLLGLDLDARRLASPAPPRKDSGRSPRPPRPSGPGARG